MAFFHSHTPRSLAHRVPPSSRGHNEPRSQASETVSHTSNPCITVKHRRHVPLYLLPYIVSSLRAPVNRRSSVPPTRRQRLAGIPTGNEICIAGRPSSCRVHAGEAIPASRHTEGRWVRARARARMNLSDGRAITYAHPALICSCGHDAGAAKATTERFPGNRRWMGKGADDRIRCHVAGEMHREGDGYSPITGISHKWEEPRFSPRLL